MEADEELSVLEVGAKWQSKKELYTILTTAGNLYLPPIAYAHQKYLRQICTGQKLYVKWSDVKIVKIPNIKGLEVANY